jgi:L-2-hydroxyglutarate oxidase
VCCGSAATGSSPSSSKAATLGWSVRTSQGAESRGGKTVLVLSARCQARKWWTPTLATSASSALAHSRPASAASAVQTHSTAGPEPSLRDEYDIAVVGGGIVGLATARELLCRRPDRHLVLLEREDTVGSHQTSHNSGVVHAGVYYTPGSLKARLCVSGARDLYEYCAEHHIPVRQSGKLIVARSSRELPRLDELERRGRLNQVPRLRRLTSTQIADIEPEAVGVAALHSPHTGVVDFASVARAMASDISRAGGTIRTDCEISVASSRRDSIRLRHPDGELVARRAVFCGGAWSDVLARQAGAEDDPRIIPFQGTWLQLRGEARPLVRSLIYPVPDPALPFLGVHLTRSIDDDVLIGPTAVPWISRAAGSRRRWSVADVASSATWPGFWRMIGQQWKAGLREMSHALSRRRLVADAARYIPRLSPDDVLDVRRSGVRAQAVSRQGALIDDFVFSDAGSSIHVRNAPSPAATAALSIARVIADRLETL